ncbi:MAG: 1-acyl-sn-glycerol-3-phosphate acyltransferase [Planctomycetaceae bacterium]|nr:1-acyl-sn-glycerol-3-phosphate acyltransferase [Planctomycetaceae bacterium]
MTARRKSTLKQVLRTVVDQPKEPNPGGSAEATAAVMDRNLVWRFLHFLFLIFCRTWLRVRTSGEERLDHRRGGLFLINHQSFLDPLMAAVLLKRPVSYLARDSLFKVPVIGWILRKTYVIPISREAARGGSIRLALERLEEGFLVGIFPEGTRSPDDEVHDFRPGFLALARRTKQPIYPVGLAGTRRVMSRGAWFIRPGRIQVVYGEPLSESDLQQLHDGEDDKALCRLARDRVAFYANEAKRLLETK